MSSYWGLARRGWFCAAVFLDLLILGGGKKRVVLCFMLFGRLGGSDSVATAESRSACDTREMALTEVNQSGQTTRFLSCFLQNSSNEYNIQLETCHDGIASSIPLIHAIQYTAGPGMASENCRSCPRFLLLQTTFHNRAVKSLEDSA